MAGKPPSRNVSKLCVRPEDPIRDAIRRIDEGHHGIALVTDAEGRLVGAITDGDIRRAILAGTELDAPVTTFLSAKVATAPPHPVAVAVETDSDVLMELMRSHSVRQIPLLDEQGRVVDLVVLEDLVPLSRPAMGAVIMAGGFGKRLLPLTEDLPKPMLPIGGRPLLEHIIEQLHLAGIRHANVSTHYKPEKIIEHFGDGQAFGIKLNYVNEDLPLGTGGALGLMAAPNETQLVINGDILTQVDFRAMLAFHQDNHAEMTVAVRQYEVQVPYGVVECHGARISGLREKPVVPFLVNAGVYLLEPSVYQLIPNGESFNMTDLICWLIDADRPVISFPIREYWLDVGQHNDYTRAQDDALRGKVTR